MADSAVDLFKFVSLRSAAEPPSGQLARTQITDGRIAAPARDAPPEVTADAPSFEKSAAATEVYKAVRAAVANITSPAQVPAANRAIGASFASGNLYPASASRSRISKFARALADRSSDSVAGVVDALDKVVIAEHPDLPGIVGYATRGLGQSDPPLLEVDFGEAFDSLYRAYVAKQVRLLNLEAWLDATGALHVVRGLAAAGARRKAIQLPEGFWSLATAPQIDTQEQLRVALGATPQLHPLFTSLVGYYRRFSTLQPIGIGDLLVVKQFLCAYEAGEIAHVENVLKGERKARNHRVLDRTEDTLVQEAETIEDVTRELQTTDRFELKSETDSTIQNDLSVELSGQVSGRYGVVEVSASAGVSYSLSTTDSQRSSNNFAKDVLDRSLSRIQKRTREQRTTRRTHEVEETNAHEINNAPGNGHIAGIYRWLDKRYKAQVYNYGKRLMFEFVVPEPAAFVLAAFDRVRHQELRPQIPQEPAKPQLVMSQISQATVDTYGGIFDLGDVKPEPLLSLTVSKPITGSDLGSQTATSHEKMLDIPEGYSVASATVSGGYEGVKIVAQGRDSGVFVSLGGQTIIDTAVEDEDFHETLESETRTFSPPLDGPVGVSVYAYRLVAFSLSVSLTLSRKPTTHRAWQIDVYRRIMDAYEAARQEYLSKLSEYEDRLAGFKASQGIVIRGRNPRVNQELIRTELKKSCLSMIARQFDTERADDVVFDGMGSREEKIDQEALTRTETTTVTVTTPNPGETVTVTTKTIRENVAITEAPVQVPAVDLQQTTEEGPIIQFLEQAFEWQQINYIFYPYFWGRLPEKWFDAQRYYDEEDPLYAKFLQAGAARTLVAVRPGFEAAVMHYLTTRQPWNGGPAPTIDDPLYVAIHEELRGQQDDLNGAAPYGTPWEVVVPTSLVYLQETAGLPTYDCGPDDRNPREGGLLGAPDEGDVSRTHS
jgi:hypothetical protein